MRTQNEVAAMLCPVCQTGLAMSDRNGVEIDYCPSCRGVWLDRGELDKIIERSTEHMPPPPPPSTQRDGRPGGLMGLASSLLDSDDDRHGDRHRDKRYDDDHYRKPRRKKSFLSDFFD